MAQKLRLAKLQDPEMLSRAAAFLRNLPEGEYKSWGPAGGRAQRILNHLVYYLNADLPADSSAYLRLLQVLYELTYWNPWEVFMVKECGWGDDALTLYRLARFQVSDLVSVAGLYQTDLKKMILWLCKPKSHPELRKHALSFLAKGVHGELWKIDYDRDTIADQEEPFDEEKEPPEEYFHSDIKYDSIVVPICKFILGYVDHPVKGLPIRVCKRPDCGKFLVPQRTGRKIYCSDDCRALDRQKHRSKEEQADYMYVHRLKQLTAGRLRKKLKLPEVENRLKEIESRRPQMKETIGELRAR